MNLEDLAYQKSPSILVLPWLPQHGTGCEQTGRGTGYVGTGSLTRRGRARLLSQMELCSKREELVIYREEKNDIPVLPSTLHKTQFQLYPIFYFKDRTRQVLEDNRWFSKPDTHRKTVFKAKACAGCGGQVFNPSVQEAEEGAGSGRSLWFRSRTVSIASSRTARAA